MFCVLGARSYTALGILRSCTVLAPFSTAERKLSRKAGQTIERALGRKAKLKRIDAIAVECGHTAIAGRKLI